MATAQPDLTHAEARDTDLPTPKFRIGDRVYTPSVTSEAAQLPCPDCLGSRKWKVFTPAGSELETNCVRCSGYTSLRDLPSLTYTKYVASVAPITIGFVKAQSAPSWNDRDRVEYMTGTSGPGTIYYEGRLFFTEAEAMQLAQAEADEKNAAEVAKPERIAQWTFANLNVDSATLAAAKAAISNSWWSYRHLRDSVAELVGLEDGDQFQKPEVDDLLSDLRWRLEYETKHRPALPLDDLLSALRAGDCEAAQAVGRKFDEAVSQSVADHVAANPDLA